MNNHNGWKRVADFPGYQINAEGLVISPRGDFVRPQKVTNDYLVIRFPTGKPYWRRKAKRWDVMKTCRGLASLVVKTFVRPKRKEEMVTFKDHDKNNCALSNLKWINRSDQFRGVWESWRRR